LPRNIIQRFSCRYNGELVFSAELHAAIAANPYIAFHTVATDSGTLVLSWEGDNGFTQTEQHQPDRLAMRHSRGACKLLLGLLVSHAGAQPRRADTRRSGFDDMGASTQAMQKDDSAQSRHAVGEGRRGAVEAARRRQRQGLRQLPRGGGKAACAAWRRAIQPLTTGWAAP
jgi:hypothetical protein